MSDTVLVSLRVPKDVLAAVDELAKQEQRSRARIILMAIRQRIECPSLNVRTQQLKGEWEFPLSIDVSKEELERGYIERNACPDCGALVGHQKWCRGK